MLSGRTILIVETQFIVALDLQNTLEGLGAARVVIAQDSAHALEISEDWKAASLSIIEVERERADQVSLIGSLSRLGIPVIGLTTDGDLHQTMGWLAAAPIIAKPVQSARLVEAIERAMRSRSDQNE